VDIQLAVPEANRLLAVCELRVGNYPAPEQSSDRQTDWQGETTDPATVDSHESIVVFPQREQLISKAEKKQPLNFKHHRRDTL
jgi:hypothetical protein